MGTEGEPDEERVLVRGKGIPRSVFYFPLTSARASYTSSGGKSLK